MSVADCFVVRTELVHEYRKFLFSDPGLPKELLPDNWNGTRAMMLFKQYYLLLADPASCFFEQIFKKKTMTLVRKHRHTMQAFIHYS